MVTLAECHRTEDQALSCLYCQKNKSCLKKHSQPRKLVPTASFRNNMASRYSYFPVSRYQDRSLDNFFYFIFYFLSVWMWTVILRVDASGVCASVFQARHKTGPRSCRAVNLWRTQTLLSYPPIIVFCLSGLPRRQTLWKPEQTFFFFFQEAWLNVKAMSWMLSLRLEKCHISVAILALSFPGSTARIISPCWLSSQRGHLVAVIHTVIFHREIKIQICRF